RSGGSAPAAPRALSACCTVPGAPPNSSCSDSPLPSTRIGGWPQRSSVLTGVSASRLSSSAAPQPASRTHNTVPVSSVIVFMLLSPVGPLEGHLLHGPLLRRTSPAGQESPAPPGSIPDQGQRYGADSVRNA